MTLLLDILARVATRIPPLTIAVLLVLTVGFGAGASLLEVDTSVESFAPSDGRAATLNEIDDRFATTDTIQVLVDAGPGGDVITPGVLDAVDRLGEDIAEHPEIEPVLAPETVGSPPVVSFAFPFAAAAEALDEPLGGIEDTRFVPLARDVLTDGGDEVTGLYSDDLTTDPPTARAGLLVVDLDATTASADRRTAQEALAALVEDASLPGTRQATLSFLAIEEGIADALERDLPVLLSVSLLLVTMVLAWLFRSVADVLVGLVGLLASIIWMVGLAGLLGPGGLGWTGPFNQVSIAVPVLLVGLGIDYAVHLTTRYREQLSRGDGPVRAARTALTTVGVALVLATIASVAGFLANAVTPLAPIRDFGIFAALGIIAAFLILSAAVPAVRTLIDRRHVDDDRDDAAQAAPPPTPPPPPIQPPAPHATPPSPTGQTVSAPAPTPAPASAPTSAGAVLEVTLDPPVETPPSADAPRPGGGRDGASGITAGLEGSAGWARAATWLATRRPGTVIAVTVVALAVGALAASGLSTEFDERDFLPEGEPVLATIDRLDALFSGDVGERTFVLVEATDGAERTDTQAQGAAGPVDPAVLAALAELEDQLAEVDQVRTVDGTVERTSPLALREQIVEAAEQTQERIADDLDDWDDPAAAATDVALPEPFDVAAFLDDVDLEELGVDDDVIDGIADRLPPGVDAARALAATSDPAEVERTVREELAEGFVEARPDHLDDEELAAAAALPPADLTLERIRELGLEGELSDGERERLEQLEALTAAGPVDSVDGEVLAGHVATLAETVPAELARVLDDRGLLVSIGTNAGQDGAAALAADLRDLADPLVDAGATVTVVSDPLVNQEIIDELSAAQLAAIAISLAAAALLLVVATYASSRAVGLGLIGIVPSVVALVLVLGSMRGLGLAFNALTATVASIAVGIGVPYGIHLTNRFREMMGRGRTPDRAIADTLANTGPALVGSAVTTGLAFAVLMLSNSVPIRQFGMVSTLMIGFALVACVLVQPALLVLWGRRRVVTGGRSSTVARGRAAA